jgi:hypothetical protein
MLGALKGINTMRYKKVIDPALLAFGDVLTVTTDGELSGLIRAGIAIHNFQSPYKIISAIRKKYRPSHTLIITDAKNRLGHEMNWPDDREISLDEYISGNGTIISCLRCPWYTARYNPDAYKVCLDKLESFINNFHSQYSLHNFFAFVLRIPQDKKNLVCSMYTLLAWITSTISEGYPVTFPPNWVIAGKDNIPWPGLVDPDEIDKWGNLAGWAVPFFRYEKE